MGKQVLRKAGTVAAESIVRDLLPFLDERFKLIDERFKQVQHQLEHLSSRIEKVYTRIDEVDRRLDARIDVLRNEMLEKFENQLGTINEVSHRITKLDGRVEGFMELFGKMVGPISITPAQVTRKRKAV